MSDEYCGVTTRPLNPSASAPVNRQTVDEVIASAIRSLDLPDIGDAQLDAESKLVDDLGFTSLDFVDLTAALEDALALDEFPMQRWIDESARCEQPLTLSSLAATCVELLKNA